MPRSKSEASKWLQSDAEAENFSLPQSKKAKREPRQTAPCNGKENSGCPGSETSKEVPGHAKDRSNRKESKETQPEGDSTAPGRDLPGTEIKASGLPMLCADRDNARQVKSHATRAVPN